MKKIILAAIAVIAAATLCACGNSTVVKDAVDTSLGEKIENMSVSAAAGTYFLTDMTEIGTNEKITKDSYTENHLELAEDGKFTFEFALEDDEQVSSFTGTYSVTQDGIVTLLSDDGSAFSIAASGEKVVCNGKKIVVSGKLGTQLAVNMVYEKPSAEGSDTGSDDNTENTEKEAQSDSDDVAE